MRSLLGRTAYVVILAAAGWWLFADTVRYHRPEQPNTRIVRFAHWGSYQEYLMWQQIIAAFHDAHPNVRVHQEYVIAMRYETKIQQQLVAGDAPDVMLFQDEPFPNFAPKGFAALDDFVHRDGIDLRRDYFDTAVASFMLSGQLRGMPLWGGDNLIYCNKRCFLKAARFRNRPVPLPDDDWTLDDFIRTAQDLTFDEDGDGRIDQFGFALPMWFYALPFMWSQGMEVLDPTNTRWAMTGPAAVRAWRFYQGLRFSYHVCPTPVEQGEMDGDTAFFTGRIAMFTSGPWAQPFLQSTTLKDDYLIVHVPQGPAGRATRVTWDCLAIYDGIPPQRKARAWEFVKFASSLPAQKIVARYQRSVPALKAGAEEFVRCDTGQGSRKFVDALTYARLQPISPYWNEMDRQINRHLAGLLNEREPRQTPEEFLDALAADPIIQRCFGDTQ
jgi:multiple sugar transport system substrate-binding protein